MNLHLVGGIRRNEIIIKTAEKKDRTWPINNGYFMRRDARDSIKPLEAPKNA